MKLILFIISLFLIPKVNFDKYFDYKDCVGCKSDFVQKFIDEDYLVLWNGSYHHHNTFLFTMLCDKLKVDDILQINGIKYRVLDITYGNVEDGDILTKDGDKVYSNNEIEILTCNLGEYDRKVIYIKAIY